MTEFKGKDILNVYHIANRIQRRRAMLGGVPSQNDCHFAEFRRKVREAELLSSALERLLLNLKFSGRLSVIIQNGRILKSGYEEGYFRSDAAKARGGE